VVGVHLEHPTEAILVAGAAVVDLRALGIWPL
jgi:hypothetical protein